MQYEFSDAHSGEYVYELPSSSEYDFDEAFDGSISAERVYELPSSSEYDFDEAFDGSISDELEFFDEPYYKCLVNQAKKKE